MARRFGLFWDLIAFFDDVTKAKKFLILAAIELKLPTILVDKPVITACKLPTTKDDF